MRFTGGLFEEYGAGPLVPLEVREPKSGLTDPQWEDFVRLLGYGVQSDAVRWFLDGAWQVERPFLKDGLTRTEFDDEMLAQVKFAVSLGMTKRDKYGRQNLDLTATADVLRKNVQATLYGRSRGL